HQHQRGQHGQPAAARSLVVPVSASDDSRKRVLLHRETVLRPRVARRVIYYRYAGHASLDQSFNGIAPNSTGALAPYSVTQGGRATVTEPSHVLSQGFTYHIDDWWSVDLDYRYSRFTSDAVGSFQSLFNGATPAAGQVSNVWRDGLSDLDFSVVFTPTSKLIIRPGVRLMKADVEALEDGVSD